MTNDARLDAIERVARSCASLVQLQTEALQEMQRELDQVRTELRQVKAMANGAQYLAGAALSE